MDLLAKRYASPFLILDSFICQNRFSEFVFEVNTISEEEKLWDVWLHKVYEKTFDEWKKSLHIQQRNSEVNGTDLEATVKDSKNILNGFNP